MFDYKYQTKTDNNNNTHIHITTALCHHLLCRLVSALLQRLLIQVLLILGNLDLEDLTHACLNLLGIRDDDLTVLVSTESGNDTKKSGSCTLRDNSITTLCTLVTDKGPGLSVLDRNHISRCTELTKCVVHGNTQRTCSRCCCIGNRTHGDITLLERSDVAAKRSGLTGKILVEIESLSTHVFEKSRSF